MLFNQGKALVTTSLVFYDRKLIYTLPHQKIKDSFAVIKT